MNNTPELLNLITPEGEQLIEQYIDMPHHEVAIKSRNALLATSIKYLEKAKSKLPSWYKAKAVINSQLFEQSSSEATALAKFQDYSGITALDLTCGLGVDSWALSHKFKQVTTVEIDPIKAKIAAHNFTKLGVSNIDIINSSAEDYCTKLDIKSEQFDLIYIDPSRITRNEKGEILKVYSLEDSSPNIIELLPQLKKLSDLIIIKLSPLFDIDECYRIFGDDSEIEIVATTTECKEVLVKVINNNSADIKEIKHTIVEASGTKTYRVPYVKRRLNSIDLDNFSAKYLYLPNVAFYKSRCIENYINQLIGSEEYIYNNYIFTQSRIEQKFEGQEFEIVAQLPYSPKLIKRELKTRGIQKATLYIKGFNYTQQQVIKDLKIKEGAGANLVFTTYNQSPVMLIVNKIIR